MVTNERERDITLAAIARFESALAVPAEPGIHLAIAKAQREGMESVLVELRREIAEYDARRAAGFDG